MKCGSGGGVEWKIMTWEIWKRKSGEILVNFSTFWGKLIDDLQKSDCYGLNSERKQSPTSSHGSLACVLLLLAVFLTLLVHFSEKNRFSHIFSSSRGVAIFDCDSHSQARLLIVRLLLFNLLVISSTPPLQLHWHKRTVKRSIFLALFVC